jgi:calcium-dependent protein kinase
LIVLYLASKEELSELREVFTFVDTKNDGYIDVEELQTALLKIYDSETAEKHAAKICCDDETLSYS